MTTYVSLNNLRVPYTMIVINLLTNVSAFFRDSHACGLRNIFVFILVRWSYDFNSSSPGLIETNQHWDYATILLFLRSHCKVLRLSCETRAELTRDLPLRTQIREYPKLCGPAFRSTCLCNRTMARMAPEPCTLLTGPADDKLFNQYWPGMRKYIKR